MVTIASVRLPPAVLCPTQTLSPLLVLFVCRQSTPWRRRRALLAALLIICSKTSKNCCCTLRCTQTTRAIPPHSGLKSFTKPRNSLVHMLSFYSGGTGVDRNLFYASPIMSTRLEDFSQLEEPGKNYCNVNCIFSGKIFSTQLQVVNSQMLVALLKATRPYFTRCKTQREMLRRNVHQEM